ncbi:MAG: immunoglobulin-like domain-containing protein [Candidatus Nomurabacteria bacterium]
MKKNILKKIIVLFSLSLIIFNINFVSAEDVNIPAVVVDTIPPVISLVGDVSISINVGDTYKDAGATAIDETDGGITSSIVIVNNVDTTKAGDYTVTYDVKDKALNSAMEVVRKVIVKDIVVPEKLKEKVIIRNGDTIIYNGYYDLPDVGNIDIPDKSNIKHSIDKRSVLAVLYGIDQNTDSFSISNLDYNNGFGSLYMKCLIPDGLSELCENWQYVVNDSYPQVGMDKDILVGNEKIYIYFGPQNKVVLNNKSITNKDDLIVTAEKYDYVNNIWAIRTGVTVGVTSPDPNNPWSPKDDIKSLVDGVTGEAKFSSIPVGSYNVGIKEDYYWPTENLIVSESSVVSQGSGRSVTSIPDITKKAFSISKALEFLSKNEKSDGSFSNDMYTDWVAISAAAGGSFDLKNNISNYLKNNSFTSPVLTDNERHAMALMSLDINPYTGTSTDYIKKITDSFDGVQFGDKALDNDDIFALIILKNSGYNSADEIIQKDINYIISQQTSNGSWGSIDITAAAIQALSGFENINGVIGSITKGKLYIISSQGTDGGFGNTFSTSWVLQSMFSNNQILKAEDFLTSRQQVDGGLSDTNTDDVDTRVWSTSYAIPAILHKPWSEILNNFSKQQGSTPNLVQSENAEKEIPIKTVEIDNKIKKEIAVDISKEKSKEITNILKKEKITKIKKSIIIHKKQQSIIDSLELKDKINIKNPDIQNKKISLIGRIWQVIKTPFSSFLFNLGF